MRPRIEFAAETRADKLRDDTDVLFRQPKHLGEHGPKVDHALRRFVERQHRSVPQRGRRMWLEWVLRLRRCDIGTVELDWRGGERTLCVAAAALQALSGAVRCEDNVRLVIRFKMGLYVRCLFGVGRADRIGGGLGSLKGLGHGQRDILAVVADDIVLEGRAPLFGDAFESRLIGSAEDSSDIPAMKDSAHTRHFLRFCSVEFEYATIGDRRPHRRPALARVRAGCRAGYRGVPRADALERGSVARSRLGTPGIAADAEGADDRAASGRPRIG